MKYNSTYRDHLVETFWHLMELISPIWYGKKDSETVLRVGFYCLSTFVEIQRGSASVLKLELPFFSVEISSAARLSLMIAGLKLIVSKEKGVEFSAGILDYIEEFFLRVFVPVVFIFDIVMNSVSMLITFIISSIYSMGNSVYSNIPSFSKSKAKPFSSESFKGNASPVNDHGGSKESSNDTAEPTLS